CVCERERMYIGTHIKIVQSAISPSWFHVYGARFFVLLFFPDVHSLSLTHTHTHTHTQTHTHQHTHVYPHKNTHPYTTISVCTQTHTHTHKHTDKLIHTVVF